MLRSLISFVIGDVEAERAVPPTGFTVRLTVFSSAAMAFLMVFALALTVSTGRLATRWGDELARSATVRISAPQGQIEAQTQAALKVLETTQGVRAARALSVEEQRDLLTPWLGQVEALDVLALPQLIEIEETGAGFDSDGLRQRLRGEVPGAVLDDHARWRKPVVNAARSLRRLGWLSAVLIIATTGALITLAANAALAANAQVIAVLRLIGARDAYIAQAFVRRFTIRALGGAALGTALGVIAVLLLPSGSEDGGLLTGLGFRGANWIWPLLIPLLVACVAFVATQAAARTTLKDLP